VLSVTHLLQNTIIKK